MNAATSSPRATSAGWIGTAAALALIALAALFIADRMYDPQRFPIERIEVHGRVGGADAARAERVGVVKTAVAESLAGNYFSVDLAAVEARVELLPWVFSAAVRRQWPGALAIEVTEVQPVARWGERHWLHASGDLVARDDAVASPTEVDNLPLLSAPDHRKDEVWRAFRHWSGRFAASGLALEQLQLDSRGLWRLRLSVGALARAAGGDSNADDARASATMIVAHDGAEARIARFIAALKHGLIARAAAMRSIDLRYPNGFAIAWEGAAPNLHLAAAE
ncbi:MAG: cell division protein FtsQ/DivIB [bacterium]